MGSDADPKLVHEGWWVKPLNFRPIGSPAGSWPHTPWHTCVFWDPYERINFWSHFLPGVVFVVLAVLSFRQKPAPGALALGIFSCCAATTHLFSALTHVWPDDHLLEKLDHIGIIALVVGTPFTALMVIEKDNAYIGHMALAGLALVAVAFLPPALRTAGFITVGGLMIFSYRQMINWNLAAQVTLYVAGGAVFVRNSGHGRGIGWSDHHLLHYFVTAATICHVFYIRNADHAVPASKHIA